MAGTQYVNNAAGTLSADPGLSGTTVSSAGFANLPVIAAPDTMWLVLDADGTAGVPEICQITAHSSGATSATVLRGQQASSARTHAIGTDWTVPVTKADLDELPFRKVNAKGDLLVASADKTISRVAVGSNDQVLTADSAQANGVKWAAIPGLADNAVSTAKIQDSAVTSGKIADGTIVTGDIADSAITSAKIADGTIVAGDLALALGRGSVPTLRATTSTDQTGIGTSFTDLNGTSISYTFPASRVYLALFTMYAQASAGATAVQSVVLNVNGADTEFLISRNYPGSGSHSWEGWGLVDSGAGGTFTVKARGKVSSGTFDVKSSGTGLPIRLVLIDIGAS